MNCESVREALVTGAPLSKPDHLDQCEDCRELSARLDAGWGDLNRGLGAWADGGDFDAAFERAVKEAPANNGWHLERGFHVLLLAAMVLFALVLAVGSPWQNRQAEAPPVDWTDVEVHLDEVSGVPWNALSDVDWGDVADDMLVDADRLEAEGAVDDDGLRELLFLVWIQTGRAAENGNNARQPYYEIVDGRVVNFYWYAAASLAYIDPSLMGMLTDSNLKAPIDYYFDGFQEETRKPLFQQDE